MRRESRARGGGQFRKRESWKNPGNPFRGERERGGTTTRQVARGNFIFSPGQYPVRYKSRRRLKRVVAAKERGFHPLPPPPTRSRKGYFSRCRARGTDVLPTYLGQGSTNTCIPNATLHAASFLATARQRRGSRGRRRLEEEDHPRWWIVAGAEQWNFLSGREKCW